MSSPPIAARTDSVVPACQYSFGRKCTSLLFHQYQMPSWGGLVVTNNRFWTLARWSLAISLLKLTMIGIPTPTVWLSPITVEALPVLPGFAIVVNVTVFDSDLPPADVPVIFAVYRVPQASIFAGTQD